MEDHQHDSDWIKEYSQWSSSGQLCDYQVPKKKEVSGSQSCSRLVTDQWQSYQQLSGNWPIRSHYWVPYEEIFEFVHAEDSFTTKTSNNKNTLNWTTKQRTWTNSRALATELVPRSEAHAKSVKSSAPRVTHRHSVLTRPQLRKWWAQRNHRHTPTTRNTWPWAKNVVGPLEAMAVNHGCLFFFYSMLKNGFQGQLGSAGWSW